jgi:hypothetical protein
MWKRLFGRRGGEATAAKQEDDVHALDVPGGPWGGVQSDEYRHARPDEIVEEGEVALGAPGGAPSEDASVDERRERDRPAGSR